MGLSEKYIRAMTMKDAVYFSDHAQKRLGERMISREFATQAILAGNVLEIQDFPDKNIHVVFQSIPGTSEFFYVIVAADYPQVVVVTVCYFEDEVWEQLGVIRQRRKK